MALCFGSWWEDEPMTADSDWYRFRKASHKIVTHVYFENIVIFLILISTVTLVSKICWPTGRSLQLCSYYQEKFCDLLQDGNIYLGNNDKLNSLLLDQALDDKNAQKEENKALRETLKWIDIVCCIFFTFEMLLKWAGLGMKYYFRNTWCILDFIIVVVSTLGEMRW